MKSSTSSRIRTFVKAAASIAALLHPLLLPQLFLIPATASAAPQSGDAELLNKGAYVARIADCVACRTAPNITPDDATGIGRYTFGQFDRARRVERSGCGGRCRVVHDAAAPGFPGQDPRLAEGRQAQGCAVLTGVDGGGTGRGRLIASVTFSSAGVT